MQYTFTQYSCTGCRFSSVQCGLPGDGTEKACADSERAVNKRGGEAVVGQYICELCKVELVAVPVYLLIRRPWRNWSKREAALAIFVLFLMGLLTLAFQGQYDYPRIMLRRALVRLQSGAGINLMPFRSIISYFRHYDRGYFMVNFWGNILMFMPWGFGLPFLWQRKQGLLPIICHSLSLTLFIETVQLFIGRSVDVDDLILNFFGSFSGAAIYFVLRKVFPKLRDFAV